MTDVVTTLRAALALISEPENWCQGSSAKDSRGHQVLFDNPGATAWCVNGAIWRAVGHYTDGDVLRETLCANGGEAGFFGSTAAFNDAPDTTHTEVVALLQKAIAKAESE